MKWGLWALRGLLLVATCCSGMILGMQQVNSELPVHMEREGVDDEAESLLAFFEERVPPLVSRQAKLDSSNSTREGIDGEFVDFLLKDADYARCLDGTAAGGYERIVPGSSTLILQLEGGGYCDDFESCSLRAADDRLGLGGSAGWARSCNETMCSGILSPDCGENPDFCNASLVLLRSCSGDHWRGTRTGPTYLCRGGDGQECGDFWFSGERILDAALKRLFDKGALRSGSRLVLAGRSSGGEGVLSLIDRLNEEVLAPKGVDVRGLLLWSVDVDHPVLPADGTPSFRRGHAGDQMDARRRHEIHGARMPRACEGVEASYVEGPWLCKPHELVRRLKTPVFVATNFWSALATGDFVLNETTCSYARRYGELAHAVYADLAASRMDHGVFAASCFAHAVPWETSVAAPACGGAGCSLRDVFASWYLGDRRGPTAVVEEECDHIPCNRLCKSQRTSRLLSTCQSSGLSSESPPPAVLPLVSENVRISMQKGRERSHFVRARSGPKRAFAAERPIDGEAGRVDCSGLVGDLHRDGYAVLRGVLPKPIIDGALQGMSRILDHHAEKLKDAALINSSYSDLPLDERGLALFGDNLEVAPKFFRSELHGSPEFYDLFTHRTVRNVAECVLKTRTLVLYPVYMGRMNLPNHPLQENGFHQDSIYTYEYFNINASAETMETFMASKVNFWAPLKDVDKEIGTLMVRRGFENRMRRYSEWSREVFSSNVTELVTDAAELPSDKLVLLDDLKAGDMVVFLHSTPHRGTPNRARGRVRWSMDWRLQNAQFSTLRPELGYLVQSDREDDKLVTRERWARVKPSPRWTERKGEVRLYTVPAASSELASAESPGMHAATAPDSCLSVMDPEGGGLTTCQQWRDHP
mmetsp:Transcript_29821/g.80718  ORF Transcript_29821/g.80718 Transcript_29821/m.80718 type:complete len:872 (-) Transcript_29821:75-2690(-)